MSGQRKANRREIEACCLDCSKKQKGRWRRKSEQSLVDSCYSNSDANDGCEAENSEVYFTKSRTQLATSVCVEHAVACV